MEDRYRQYREELHQLMIDQGGMGKIFDLILEESKSGKTDLPISLTTAYRLRKKLPKGELWPGEEALSKRKCSTLDAILKMLGFEEISPLVFRACDIIINERGYQFSALSDRIHLDKSHLHYFMSYYYGNTETSKGVSIGKSIEICSFLRFPKLLWSREEDLNVLFDSVRENF